MVCRIIWVDGVVLRGTEVAKGYREPAIVTTKKTNEVSTNRRELRKAYTIERIPNYQEKKIGKQWSCGQWYIS